MELKQMIYAKLRRLPWRDKTIIFAHMPKAAGSSLKVIMQAQYGKYRVHYLDPTKPVQALEAFKRKPLWKVLNYRAISAHVLWGIHEWLPKPFIYITVLRDPVERVLSFYSYVRSSPTHRLHKEVLENDISLEEFLEWEKSVFEVSNLQTKLLSTPTLDLKSCDVERFERARRNLVAYCIVGLTEEFPKTLKMFSSLFHWKNVEISYVNVTPRRLRRDEVPRHIIRKIERLNHFDMELYQVGRQLFTNQEKDLPGVLSSKITR